jgi:hypothetical protein
MSVNLRKLKKLLFLLLLLFTGTINTSAFQAKSKISGYVIDAKTKEPIPGATVILEDTNFGGITNVDGYYLITDVPPKSYSLKVSFVGYESVTKFGVILRSGGIPDVNIELYESISTLEEVVITANPFQKSEETPLSIQKLSREEIATYPGGNNDIAKVVQSLPGVQGSIGGFRNDVIIRGGAPNENVYYLDGIEIPNINHFATQGSAGGPVGMLNVSFFEGVTLSTSAFGAEYDNPLSGVLQFDQRNGNNRKFKANFRLSSSESALTFEGPLFKGTDETANTTFIASIRRSYLQVLFSLIDLPFLPDYWDYQYKVNHKIDQYNEIMITGIGSVDDFSINVPKEYDAEQQATLDQVPIIKQNSNTVGISWTNRFKNGSGFLRATLSNNRLENDFRQYGDNVNESDLYFQNISNEEETKLRLNYTKFINDWTLASTGTIQGANYTNETIDLVNNYTFNSDINFAKYGFSFQASNTQIAPRLGVSFGFRMDGNTFTNEGNEFWRTFSPRISGSYQIDNNNKWSLNASIGRYFKIPPYTILGFKEGDVFINKNAKYIQSDHLVLGTEYLLNESSRISLEGFYKKYKNYPVSINDSVSLANLGGDFSVLGNEPIASVGLGRTYGLEALYQKKFTNNFYAILAYTLYWSEFTAFDQETYLPSAWDSRNLITFTGGYQFGDNWEISARMRYVGPSPYAPVNEQATLENYPAIIRDYSQLGDVRLATFNQTDLRVDKKWNFDKWTFNLFIEIQNILGQDVPQEPEYGLERDSQGNILIPENLVEIEGTDSSSVLPSIGIVIDF